MRILKEPIGKVEFELDEDLLEKEVQKAIKAVVRDKIGSIYSHDLWRAAIRDTVRQTAREWLVSAEARQVIHEEIFHWLDSRDGWVAKLIKRAMQQPLLVRTHTL